MLRLWRASEYRVMEMNRINKHELLLSAHELLSLSHSPWQQLIVNCFEQAKNSSLPNAKRAILH